jgi:precorrin-3B methylase
MLMAPLVRRSWSLRGHTPVLRQRGRSQHKVSAIAALCVLPKRDRIALYFRLHRDANINTERAMDFLEHLQRQLHTPIVLVWDSFQEWNEVDFLYYDHWANQSRVDCTAEMLVGTGAAPVIHLPTLSIN